ncbi:sensor histidine kinase [Nocardiopsis ganjiahuensis]|uniref:sensor histidine kinase n=1 Tax=Nocardiopsis ganjiahuensis TaxID=239984 RepID=UPI000347D010|nr:histidine kinase [Nocardiopsis ganjiahuensis]
MGGTEEADTVEHGERAAAAAPTVPGSGAGPGSAPVADPDTGGTEELTPPAMSKGFARRIRRARQFCLVSMAVFAFLIPFLAGANLMTDLALASDILADRPRYLMVLALVRSLVMFVASILCALAAFRMIRERLDGRQSPERRLYWYAASLFLVLCLFTWYTPNVFSLCATAWVLGTFLTPRERIPHLTVVLVGLPWLNALLSPLETPVLPARNSGGSTLAAFDPNLLGLTLIMAVWSAFLWMGCLYTVWLWDGIRQVTDGQQARAQLAVDGERLRFTNDMRELLGHRLDALKLGARRAGELVRADPRGAEAEIGQVHDLARTTLRQVRSMVRGYRDIDLGAEVSSVRAVLEANGTAAAVTGLAGLTLPADTAALAAWVVREGGTNVLRHSRAQRCRISFTVVGDPGEGYRELVVEVANDRARDDEPEGAESGSGLAGLTERISEGGGALSADRTNDGGFLLRAVLPLPDGPLPPGAGGNGTGGPPSAVPGQPGGGTSVPASPSQSSSGARAARRSGADRPGAGPAEGTSVVRANAVPVGAVPGDPGAGSDPATDRPDDRRVRIARRIITAMIGFNGLVVVALALSDLVAGPGLNLPPWRSAVGVAISVVVAVLLIGLLRERLDGNRQPSPKLLWSSVGLLLLCAVFLNTPPAALIMIGSWWGTGIFFASRRDGVLITVLLLLSPLPLLPTFSTFFERAGGISPLAYGLLWLAAVVFALFFVLSTFGTVWLWDISREAVAGERARAQLAVTQERLRFARDMHDLLGHSLSALAVKAQLAGRLVDRAPERASTEIAEVQALARQALQQVRSAVIGYREVDLEGEVEAVTAVLDSGGTRTVVTGLDGLELPPKVAGLAAWVVREGGTNVMRHSDAEECQISFTLTREIGDRLRQLVVEIHNDSAREEKGGRGDGNGLAGLSERVAMSGGTLSRARTKDGGFLLRAIIPL